MKEKEVHGGFFIPTGKTGESAANQLLQEDQISLIGGQRLVDFVLGQK